MVLAASAKHSEGEDKDGTQKDAETDEFMPERQVIAGGRITRQTVFVIWFHAFFAPFCSSCFSVIHTAT